jgi:uncharacterized protein YihD (DUF1040 family)
MRDPKRIDSVLQMLRTVWEQQPDLRLGQLLVIAARPKEPCPEVFYMEDEVLMRELLHYRETLTFGATPPDA